MSKFRTHTLEPRDADEEQCNVRVWDGGEEGYCVGTGIGKYRRCARHTPSVIKQIAREERELLLLQEAGTIEERAEILAKERRNLTSLDNQVLRSLATIHFFDDIFADQSMSMSEATTMSRLRREHADLVHKRTDLEIKLKAVLDGTFLYEKSQEIFEAHVTDKNTRAILLQEVGKMLDELVDKGSATGEVDG